MKVEKAKTNRFQPVNVTLTIESQAELDFFGSLFNHVAISAASKEFLDAGKWLDFEPLYELLEGLGADIHRVEDLKLFFKQD